VLWKATILVLYFCQTEPGWVSDKYCDFCICHNLDLKLPLKLLQYVLVTHFSHNIGTYYAAKTVLNTTASEIIFKGKLDHFVNIIKIIQKKLPSLLTPVIQATWEAEIKKIIAQGHR
jgi:hypothetical protein